VTAAIAASPGGVTSFNSRTGAITLLGSDISAAGGALIASPTFTGTPAAPTATPGTNTTQLATTAFVANAISTAGGVNSFNGRAGVVTLNTADVQSAAGAVYRQAASPPGSANETFWFDQVGGQLYIQYVDPSTSAKTWVVANAPTPPTSPINLPGVTDGSSAPAGMVGEYLTGTGSAAAVTVASYWRNCASLVLSAGDWDVWCDAYTTGMSSMFGIALSLNSGGVEGSTGSGNSDPRPLQLLWGSSTFMGTPFAFDGPFKRVNITTSQTWYLQVMATLATSSQSSGVTTGAIYARRRR
jgi:hypothetical protein